MYLCFGMATAASRCCLPAIEGTAYCRVHDAPDKLPHGTLWPPSFGNGWSPPGEIRYSPGSPGGGLKEVYGRVSPPLEDARAYAPLPRKVFTDAHPQCAALTKWRDRCGNYAEANGDRCYLHLAARLRPVVTIPTPEVDPDALPSSFRRSPPPSWKESTIDAPIGIVTPIREVTAIPPFIDHVIEATTERIASTTTRRAYMCLQRPRSRRYEGYDGARRGRENLGVQ
jgi:hypothetical protein